MSPHQLQSRPLFDGTMTGGVYRLIAPASQIVEALQEAGWQAASLVHGDTMTDFLANVGVALQFPEYYGRNLDALWDCLGDLDQPTALVWSSWHELAIQHAPDWARVIALLEERTQLEPAFALILA